MTDEQARQGRRAYIGSFTSAGGHGVTTAAVDPRTGALTPLHRTGGSVPDPSYLTISGGILYAVSETAEGAAAAFSLADPDRPVLLGEPTPVAGAGPTHLAVADGRLFTANYGSGSVSTLPVRADGTLGGSAAVQRHEGHGPVTDRQEGPHAHAVVPDPSGRWLLATDLGTDEVRIYALYDGDSGAGRAGGTGGAAKDHGPVPHRTVRLRGGTGPRYLVFHPNGVRAYVISELESTVTACRWDAERGELEPLGETPTLPRDAGTAGHAGAAGGEEDAARDAAGAADGRPGTGNYPSALALSADGRFAWAANRGHDSVAVLTLDPAGDVVTLAGTVPCGGHWPRDLALHPSGRWLYVAGERSGEVTWFALDPDTGVPRRGGAMPAPAASCIVFG